MPKARRPSTIRPEAPIQLAAVESAVRQNAKEALSELYRAIDELLK